MKSINIAKILLVIAVLALMLIPILAFTQKSVGADETDTAISSDNGDYVFFVVEEGQTPLAALPSARTNHDSLTWFVVLSSVFVAAFIYSMWCLTLKHNANVMVEKLPVFLRGDLRSKNVFLHPLATAQAIKDAEYCVTFKYVNY